MKLCKRGRSETATGRHWLRRCWSRVSPCWTWAWLKTRKTFTVLLKGVSRPPLSYWQECQGTHCLTDRGVKAVIVLLTGVSRPSLSFWQGCQGNHCLTDRDVKAVTVLLTGVSRQSMSYFQWLLSLWLYTLTFFIFAIPFALDISVYTFYN